jgi:hypothetical protein
MSAFHGKKPAPLLASAIGGALCPHCGKRSYSAAGVHPQCAQSFASKQMAVAKKK